MAKYLVYLDYAAATPLDDQVLKVMKPYFAHDFYNPSAGYLKAKEVKKDLEEARAKVAKVIGAKEGEIIFTAGATEANNLAIKGVMANHPGKKMVISAIEHPAVSAPAESFKTKIAPVDNQGIIELKELKKLIDDDTTLISIIYASNEIGTIEPLAEVSRLVRDINRQRLSKGLNLPLYFHSDAAQAGAFLDLHVGRLGIDLMSINGGKIYGPKQSGLLYVKSGVRLKALIDGGGQERGLRSGTENVAGNIGLALALELAQRNRRDLSAKTAALADYFISELTSNFNCQINGSLNKRIASNVHVTFPKLDNEWLLIKLDEAGIMAAAGSACSAASIEPSSVLKALGLTDEMARSSIRFSLGKATTKEDISYTVKVLKELLA